MKPANPEAVAWLMGAAFSGFAVLCAAAFVYEKTRKKIEHPELGRLTYEWDGWTGALKNYKTGEPSVRFEIPGVKSGPDESGITKLVEFWKTIAAQVDAIRPHAKEEFEEIRPAYEGETEEELMAEIAAGDDAKFDQNWSLVSIELSSGAAEYHWALEFEVSWDPEHTRSAYLDEARELVSYTLSCAGPDTDED